MNTTRHSSKTLITSILIESLLSIGSSKELAKEVTRIKTETTHASHTSHTTSIRIHTTLKSFFAKLVIDLTLLLITQNFISLTNILELLFSLLFVIFITIWMPFQSKLSVSLLKLFVSSISTHPKNTVVILTHINKIMEEKS